MHLSQYGDGRWLSVAFLTFVDEKDEVSSASRRNPATTRTSSAGVSLVVAELLPGHAGSRPPSHQQSSLPGPRVTRNM